MKLLLGVLIFICLLLAACGRPTQIPATPGEGVKETPLLTDADIDKAVIQVPKSTLNLLGIEGGSGHNGTVLPALSNINGNLTTQAVLPNTSGFVYYIKSVVKTRKDGTTFIEYTLLRHNQATNVYIPIYLGLRQIQSVSGSLDGNLVVVSMRETTAAGSDYEIFLLEVSNPGNPFVVQMTTDSVDNTNVSMSHNRSRIAYEEPIANIATVIIVRLNGILSVSRSVLTQIQPQRQPSLSGDSKYLSLVRDLTTGEDRVLVYDIALNRYTAVVTSPTLLEHPSLADNGLKVAWLENATTDQIFLKNLINATTQSIVSGSSLDHPHLTADGKFITYRNSNTIQTKDLTSTQVVTIDSGVGITSRVYAPVWQKVFNNKLPGAVTNSRFGTSVSVSGDLMVVGAAGENNFTGAAYIYQRNSLGVWNLVKKLMASDGAAFDLFGISVAISGNVVVVGAYQEDHDTNGNGTDETDVGAAYIFSKDQGGTNNWGQVKKLIASDDAASDSFGYSVSINNNTVVVGAFNEDHDTNGNGTVEFDAGAAYIFFKDQDGTNNWGQVKKLIANDDAAGDRFGISVAISGNTVVVGAPIESHDTNGNGTDETEVGAAYIFSKDQGGTNTWGQVKKLIANDDAANDRFGWSVSISGNTVVVGAFRENRDTDGNGTIENAVGAAYIFAKDQGGINNWGQVKKLIASDDAAGDFFGNSVSISGNTVVVGAFLKSYDTDEDGTEEISIGAAYIFQKDQGSLDNWGQVGKLTAYDGAAFEEFGGSVSISGSTVMVGASFANLSGTAAGAVYFYQ